VFRFLAYSTIRSASRATRTRGYQSPARRKAARDRRQERHRQLHEAWREALPVPPGSTRAERMAICRQRADGVLSGKLPRKPTALDQATALGALDYNRGEPQGIPPRP
jgi:hypothetical protein